MFTGIIEDIGKINSAIRFKDRLVLAVSTKFAKEIKVGESIAVNGACLTVTEVKPPIFKAEVVSETLSRSSLQSLKYGESVNLERAMPASGRFDGHIVQGHVDCRSIITNVSNTGAGFEMEIQIPGDHKKYLTEKGSITVDGVSLTVASLNDRYFRVAVIPHTLSGTTLSIKKIGDHVNLEFDVLSKYVENMIGQKSYGQLTSMKEMKIDEEFLKKAGFVN